MNNNIFIPKKCKVGFNERSNTYTKKLGYIIYNDGKVWRKEASWNSWIENYISQEDFDLKKQISFNNAVKRCSNIYNEYFGKEKLYYHDSVWEDVNKHKTLEDYLIKNNLNDLSNYDFKLRNFHLEDTSFIPVEFDNEPTEGFVLNKKVGGGNNSGWHHRDSYCRVYDPRGFEFEITISNLLYILENTNSIKGKGLEGKFIYGWDKKDLVLLPENAPEYQEMVLFTKRQYMKISKKSLIKGATYRLKNGKEVIFLDENYYYSGGNEQYRSSSKKLWFSRTEYNIIETISLNSLAEVVSEDCVSNYTELIETLESNYTYSPYNVSLFEYEPYILTDDLVNSLNYTKKYYVQFNGVYYDAYNLVNGLKNNRWYYNSLALYSSNPYEHYKREIELVIPESLSPREYLDKLGGLFTQKRFLKNGKESR